jgi:hypothetical protein
LTEFHGIPWNSNLTFIKFNFPWNSMEKYNEKNPSDVYEKFHGFPWKIP